MADHILEGILSVLIFLCLFILKDFKKIMADLQSSVNSLNITMAKLLERDISKDKLIETNRKNLERFMTESDRRQEVLLEEQKKIRERLHEWGNEYISKIQANFMQLEDMKSRFKKDRT